MGKILGICISEKRGTEKHEIQEANLVKDWGIEGDAHGGKSDRRRIRSSGASGGNQIPDRRCGAGADADRKGMSQPLSDIQADG